MSASGIHGEQLFQRSIPGLATAVLTGRFHANWCQHGLHIRAVLRSGAGFGTTLRRARGSVRRLPIMRSANR